MKRQKVGMLALLVSSALTGCANTPPKPDYQFAQPVQINASVMAMAKQYQAPLPPLPIKSTVNTAFPKKPIVKHAVNTDRQVSPIKANTQMMTPLEAEKLAQASYPIIGPNHPFSIWPQERYIDAINRWVRESGFENIAIRLPPKSMDKLEKKPAHVKNYRGTFRVAIRTLSRELEIPLYLHTRIDTKQAAIVPWEMPTQITMVKGTSLKDALKNLATDYGWRFIEGKQGQSYLARNDFSFPAAYPITTPRGDFSMALEQVLAPYPVRAELLDSTHTLFILDEK
ncbi:hypothetical protein ETN89_19595 (plasmid) [Photobacterium damselae subsp. damselae]|uniref:hypothetical protein n=1 Tax=Photobacterium damselae TaxID=38293 RepID=UPI000A2FE819|nr:hypothetical protein [Photobacterium damselae]ARR51788.1 hypothetical protein CAY62_20445 [Photobacterium damselae subsp. damselae]QAY37547.1 hypothetical protein ETN89_19595 [Photobacterium damselae subsp. damselae]